MNQCIKNNTGFKTVLTRVAVLLLVLCADTLFCRAQERAESQKFFYKQGKAVMDSSYMTNEATMAQIRHILNTTDLSNLEYLVIESGASPEGSEALNSRLSIERGEALGRFLEANIPGNLLEGKTTVKYNGEDWEGLRRLIAADASIGEAVRTRILNIIDSDVPVATKKNRLNAVPGYKALAEKYYPVLRYAFLYLAYTIPEPVLPDIDTDIELAQQELITPVFEPLEVTVPHVEPGSHIIVKPLFAVSTNVLYDLALTPNIALEVPLGKRWSLYGEYTFPWWVTKGNDRAWEILKWDLGARYWMSRRRSSADVLTGHFLGLDLSAGYYDIEPRHTGWQGEGVAATLEYGYAWRLGKNWRIDAYLGAGWMGTEYRYYEADEADAHLLYKYTGRFNWLGPTKAGVSIKYLFTHTDRRKRK